MTELKQEIDKAIKHFEGKIESIHGSTLNPGVIESIRVPYNDQQVPISEVGYVSFNNAQGKRYIEVQVYDPSLVGIIANCIQKHGHSAYAAKTIINVSIPLASAETRDKNKKRVNELAEEARVAIRKIRQSFRTKALKAAVSEDDKKDLDAKIQKTVDDSINTIARLTDVKHSSL